MRQSNWALEKKTSTWKAKAGTGPWLVLCYVSIPSTVGLAQWQSIVLWLPPGIAGSERKSRLS